MTNDEQAERDRRVGAAVVAWLVTPTPGTPDELDDIADILQADGRGTLAKLLRAIAAALREEAGR